VLSVDEFLTLRREVLQLLKQYDQPTTVADDTAPGEEVEAPPGEEPDEQPVVVSKCTLTLFPTATPFSGVISTNL
jgi:pre-mRNA-processing factor 39